MRALLYDKTTRTDVRIYVRHKTHHFFFSLRESIERCVCVCVFISNTFGITANKNRMQRAPPTIRRIRRRNAVGERLLVVVV